MDRPSGHVAQLAQAVDGIAQRVKHPPPRALSGRAPRSAVRCPGPAARASARGGVHHNAADGGLIEMLVDFDDPVSLGALDLQRAEHGGKFSRGKPYIDNRTNDASDLSFVHNVNDPKNKAAHSGSCFISSDEQGFLGNHASLVLMGSAF